MSGFRAVNTTLTVQDPAQGKLGDETTPTTPRPHRFFQQEQSHDDSRPTDDPSAKTPTRDSFNGIAGQRPLPSAPYTPPSQETKLDHPTSAPTRTAMSREGSHRSAKSLDSQDIDMEEEEDDDDETRSDNESANSDSTRPAKKKKGQRFFCTDFPPCQLSFTRSEHLARHIRYEHRHQCKPVTNAKYEQKTYRRTTIPMSLLETIFALGQLATTCPDCPCQRRHPRRFAGCNRY